MTTRRTSISLLVLACALVSCSGRERDRRASISSYARDCSEELALRIAADAPTGGTVLLLLPPGVGEEEAFNKARMAAAREALPDDRYQVEAVNVEAGEYVLDMRTGGMGVRDYTAKRFLAWVGGRSNVAGVISFVGWPEDATPQNLEAAPALYWVNYGRADPATLRLLQAKKLRGMLTFRGANEPAPGIAHLAPAILKSDQYEILAPSP